MDQLPEGVEILTDVPGYPGLTVIIHATQEPMLIQRASDGRLTALLSCHPNTPEGAAQLRQMSGAIRAARAR